jgi:undecaprenyl-diphosphatase
MPLLVLVAVALAFGAVAALLASRYPGAPAAVARPTVDVAQEAGRTLARHGRLRALLGRRLDPQQATGLALTLASVVVFVGGLVLAALALVVRASDGLVRIDSAVANWGARHATAASTQGLKVVTQLGETWTVLAVGLTLALIELVRTRSRWVAPFLVLVVAGDKLLTTSVKELVDRARPALNPIAETLGPSFPSGHSSTAAAFWAAAALVVSRWCPRRVRVALVGVAVALAVAVAASRVLLDVHWLTDVLGGLALGWAWFAVCAVAFGGRLLRFGATAEVAQQAAAVRLPRPPRLRSGRARPR